jgi:hypothetical protein
VQWFGVSTSLQQPLYDVWEQLSVGARTRAAGCASLGQIQGATVIWDDASDRFRLGHWGWRSLFGWPIRRRWWLWIFRREEAATDGSPRFVLESCQRLPAPPPAAPLVMPPPKGHSGFTICSAIRTRRIVRFYYKGSEQVRELEPYVHGFVGNLDTVYGWQIGDAASTDAATRGGWVTLTTANMGRMYPIEREFERRNDFTLPTEMEPIHCTFDAPAAPLDAHANSRAARARARTPKAPGA